MPAAEPVPRAATMTTVQGRTGPAAAQTKAEKAEGHQVLTNHMLGLSRGTYRMAHTISLVRT